MGNSTPKQVWHKHIRSSEGGIWLKQVLQRKFAQPREGKDNKAHPVKSFSLLDDRFDTTRNPTEYTEARLPYNYMRDG